MLGGAITRLEGQLRVVEISCGGLEASVEAKERGLRAQTEAASSDLERKVRAEGERWRAMQQELQDLQQKTEWVTGMLEASEREAQEAVARARGAMEEERGERRRVEGELGALQRRQGQAEGRMARLGAELEEEATRRSAAEERSMVLHAAVSDLEHVIQDTREKAQILQARTEALVEEKGRAVSEATRLTELLEEQAEAARAELAAKGRVAHAQQQASTARMQELEAERRRLAAAVEELQSKHSVSKVCARLALSRTVFWHVWF